MNDKIKNLLTRGVVEVIEKDSLETKLNSGRKLRIKFGVDPTANILHLGHSVCLLKLREFQDLGHQIIFLIGDFTARIGDPTGKTTSRIPLSIKQIKENMRNYKKQASLVLNMDKVEIRNNTEWWDKMDLKEMMLLAAKVTYGQVSARADFKKRLQEDKDFTLEEFMYPVLQGYDSVELRADVEIGGTDQVFNMLMGRRIQKKYNQEPQDVITCPLLIGLDGKEKMSKSLENYVGIAESAKEQFGKIMSLPDELIINYMRLLTGIPEEEINKMEKELKSGAVNPKEPKARLGFEIAKFYHNAEEAEQAKKEFERVFSKKEMPSEMSIVEILGNKINIIDFLADNKILQSKSEARRLIEQGGVEIDKKKIDDWQKEVEVKDGSVIQIGKRKFIKIKIK